MKKFSCVLLSVLFITAPASGFTGIIKSDLEVLRARAGEVKERAKKLMTNPFFLSVLGCLYYAGPRSVVREHPLLSVMGVGLVLSYLKGDVSVHLEGAEISFRVLRKGDRKEAVEMLKENA
jgi:hypothetical protein